MSINASPYDDRYSGTDNDTAARPGGDSSQAAARLLERTALDTDRWRSEARTEAEAIVTNARAESAELVRAAKEEAERTVSSARDEAAQTTADARGEADRVRTESHELREKHDQYIAGLEQVASDHRARLREHLSDMLAKVDATP